MTSFSTTTTTSDTLVPVNPATCAPTRSRSPVAHLARSAGNGSSTATRTVTVLPSTATDTRGGAPFADRPAQTSASSSRVTWSAIRA
ncbi:hypothetical protein ABZW30_32575 [Kitasatospora sp. NPDC004669]|uniref:hypothetical protein n=1 Tax=Kitasatospora sp. NPDC004669 TaxID=3154555 RepID=UPI0033A03B56